MLTTICRKASIELGVYRYNIFHDEANFDRWTYGSGQNNGGAKAQV